MKKITAMILLLAMVLALAACDLVALRFSGLYKVIFFAKDNLIVLLFAEKRF